MENWSSSLSRDKLNGYRHFGDLRYLTDVTEGRSHDVRLLSSSPAIDRMLWMGSLLVEGHTACQESRYCHLPKEAASARRETEPRIDTGTLARPFHGYACSFRNDGVSSGSDSDELGTLRLAEVIAQVIAT